MFRCRPWRWVLGILFLAPLYLFVIYQPREAIESDLTTRAQTALGEAGLSWAIPSFQGRDGIISGKAGSDEEREQAHRIVENVRGVRIVEDRAGLIPLADPFVWTAKHKENKIRLKGYIPTERDRGSILGIAKANFPEFPIDDAMELARGVGSREAWIGGVSYGLSLLGHLKRGTVSLSNSDLIIEGDPLDLASYRKVTKLLSDGMPAGLNLKASSISLPEISPYQWTATLKESNLLIEGFIPGEHERQLLQNVIEGSGKDLTVSQKLELAAGTPKGWTKNVLKSFVGLLKLESGELIFSGTDISIKGTAPDKETADEVLSIFNGNLSSSFSPKVEIDFIAPVEPVLPDISPYRLTAETANGVLTISGHVQSERTKDALLEKIKSLFPDLRLVDDIELGRGGPGEDKWLEFSRYGLHQLKGLKFGTLQIIDNLIMLSGEAESEPAIVTIFSEMKNAPFGANIDFSKVRPPLASPYRWSASRDNGKLIVLGHVPDDGERKLLLSLAKKYFHGIEVVDQMQFASGEPENWLDVAQLGLQQLAALKSGKIQIEDLNVNIEGIAPTPGILDDILAFLKVRLPKGFSFYNALEIAENEDQEVAALAPATPVAPDICQELLNSGLAKGTIQFETDSAKLSETSEPLLDKLAHTTKRCSGAKIEIAGHTDSDGDDDYNLKLSQDRAESVVNYLINAGVARDILSAVGYGETKPVVDNETEEGKARNRRIEFRVIVANSQE